MNARIRYNYTVSPLMDMAFLDECFIANKKAVCELILEIARRVPRFYAVSGRDYRGKKVWIEDVDAFEKIDLSSSGFYVVDEKMCEVAHFSCMWWNTATGGFNYPSVRIQDLVLAGFDGDWRGYCDRLKVFTEITAPLWASIQYCPVTKSWSQDFKLHTAHETKIPSLGLADYFGRAYLNGIFGGWGKVGSALGERARRDGDGFWVSYADYMSMIGESFECYRAETERALLDCDIWGVDSNDKFPIKSSILNFLGMDSSSFESPELRAIGDAIIQIGEIARRVGNGNLSASATVIIQPPISE